MKGHVSMLITTLGTSHGSHTMTRNNTATLFETGGFSYLVDCGEPVAGSYRRAGKDLGDFRALFVTHLHADHVGGLAQLTNMLKHGRKEEQTVTYCLPAEGIDRMQAYLEMLYIAPELRPFNLELFGVQEGPCYEDERISVTALPSGHLENLGQQYAERGYPNHGQAFSYRMEVEGKRVGFSGDLPRDFRYLDRLVADPLDLLIMEMTHIRPEDVLPWLADRPIAKLLLTHIWDPYHGAGEDMLREMCFEHLSFPFTIARDGMEIEL